MRRIIPIVIVIIVLSAFAGTLWFLYQKSRKKPVVFETSTPLVTDIVKKTVATGAIVPRQEIEIKPRSSGIIQSIHVEPGQRVEEDQLIAQIRVVPNMASLSQAESRLDAARISFENAKRELERNRSLFEKAVISDAELSRHRLDHELKKQEVEAARSNLQIVREGATRTSSKGATNNTQVRSTVAGMVLEVPVKQGASVIESNTFNPGTTIAVIADMGDMIFQGQVDESEVGKLEEGMELDIKIGALDNQVFKGKLEYIAPKGVQTEGVIQFEVKAAIEPAEGVFIRAGYSANADIVLDRRAQVLAISERFLQFDKGTPYVEVEIAPQTFERRDVKVGLSDGINIELLGGVGKDDAVKKP
jgi:HlyD family secretion protein